MTTLEYTTQGAAEYMGVSVGTVRKWTNEGHIKCYRTPGNQRRYSQEDLDMFLKSLNEEVPDGKIRGNHD